MLCAQRSLISRRVVKPCRRATVIRCQASKKNGTSSEKVEKTVEELRKASIDSDTAKKILKLWKENGVSDDPDEMRKLFRRRSSVVFAGFAFQLLIDAIASYSAYRAYEVTTLGPDFFGRGVLSFIFAFATLNYALAFVSNGASMAIAFNSVRRFGTNAAAYLEAIKEIAGHEDIDAVQKMTRVMDSMKIANALEAMDAMLKERAAAGGKGNVSTLESLSVFLTLEQAKEKFGFEASKYGVDEGEAFSIARMFSKYDTNDDCRLDKGEFSQLCSDLGRELDPLECTAAMEVLDQSNSGYIEFPEFVHFWVDPKSALSKVDSKVKEAKEEEKEPALAGSEQS